jgi:hypothetical protein
MRSSSTTPSGLNHISKSSTALTLETVDLTFNFDMTYTQLRDLAETNRTYFSQQKTDVCRRFERLLILLSHSLELSIPLIRYLTENFHHFDYNSEVKQKLLISIFLCVRFQIDSCEWLSNISCSTWSSMFTNVRYS